MLVVSYYTNEKYRRHAEAMKASAEAVGLKCIIEPKPDLGAWWKNCNYKSAFVLECLDRFGDEPILWQDSDTRFLKYPKLLEEIDADMAAFFWSTTIPIGGTLWFNGRSRARRYVEAWAKTVADNPTREDDSINFRESLASIRKAHIKHLPPTYCWNEPSMRLSYPGVTDPVILHSFAGNHDYPEDKPKVSP